MGATFAFKSHRKPRVPETPFLSTGNSRLGRIKVRSAHSVLGNKRVLTCQQGLTKSRIIDYYSCSREGKGPHLLPCPETNVDEAKFPGALPFPNGWLEIPITV